MIHAIRYLLLFCLLTVVLSGHTQTPVAPVPQKHKVRGMPIFNFQFHYTYQWPDGDLARRFGNLSNLAFGALYKSANHWIVSGDIGYQFGSEVKETGMLINLTNSSGVIMNTGGSPADYTLSQRGLNFNIMGGRLFPFSHRNPNSGILVMLGGGYMMHKINISNSSNDIPTLTADLKEGYDRLTGGYALHEFAGYLFHSRNRFLNFYAGVDFVQGFTQSIRGYNYDQMKPDTENRRDFLYGIKVGWLIPIYLNDHNEDEFDFR